MQVRATRESAGDVAAKELDHSLPENRPRPQESQQVVLQKNNKTTYSLRPDQDHQEVSR